MKPIQCPSCKKEISVEKLIDQCSDYQLELNSVEFTCSSCWESIDCRILTGSICFGYIYLAGMPHFSTVETIECPEISARKGSSGLLVTFSNQKTWEIKQGKD